jgi:hypothetical protein
VLPPAGLGSPAPAVLYTALCSRRHVEGARRFERPTNENKLKLILVSGSFCYLLSACVAADKAKICSKSAGRLALTCNKARGRVDAARPLFGPR